MKEYVKTQANLFLLSTACLAKRNDVAHGISVVESLYMTVAIQTAIKTVTQLCVISC